jgi:threonylcarbamoyladenosine tRNA methylthiotransferase MtaB
MQDTRSIMQEQFSYHVSWVMHHASNIHTKNFIVVQTGCDNYCTFCLTVHKRGVHITRPLEDIIADINESAQSWGKEVVLTGVNIAAWWCSNSTKPEQSKFAQLLQNILDHTAIPRIRLSSLWPEYLHDDIFPVLQNPRIMPHFHLSIQSFSDGVLQRMKRNYDSETLVRVLKKIRSLKTKVPVSIGADIIVWFPWETEKEFQETLAGIQKYKINKVHSFPFSAHQLGETIPASLLPDQIDAVTKKIREKELKKIADELAEQFHQLNKDIVHSVLVEWKWSGRTENYLKVSVDPKHKRGEMIQMKI